MWSSLHTLYGRLFTHCLVLFPPTVWYSSYTVWSSFHTLCGPLSTHCVVLLSHTVRSSCHTLCGPLFFSSYVLSSHAVRSPLHKLARSLVCPQTTLAIDFIYTSSAQSLFHTQADLHSVPKVENTNVDQSVGLIHIALTGCGLGVWVRVRVRVLVWVRVQPFQSRV